MLASPILTRLYSPVDFGAFAIYTAILSILMSIASLRYEQAIPLPQDDDVAANLLILSLLFPVVISVMVLVIAGMCGRQALYWMHAPSLYPYLWLLPISLLGGAAYQGLSAWAIRVHAFARLAQTKVSQGVGQIAVQLGVGVLEVGPFGLLLGDAVGRMSGTGVLAGLARLREIRCRCRRDTIIAAARRYRRFPIYTTWATLLNIMSLQIPFVLLARYFSVDVSGHYALSFRVLGWPSMLIGQAVGQVFLAQAAQAVNDPGRLRQLTEKTAVSLFAIGLPICGVLVAAGPLLFSTVFGAQWATAGRYAQILAPWFLLWLIASPLSGLLAVREWQGASLVFTIFEFSARLVSILVGYWFGSAWLAVVLLAVSGSLIAVTSLAWFFHGAYSHLLHIAAPIGRILLAAIATFLPIAMVLFHVKPLIRMPMLLLWAAAYYAVIWGLRGHLLEVSDGR